MACPERYKYEIYYWWEKNPYRCARDTEPCSAWRLGWCRGYIPLAVLIIAAGLYFGIGLARAMEKTENQIVTYGPADWREKLRECDRRAILINGYVDFVDDARYCIVKK